MGTGVETCERTQDGNGDGAGTETRAVAEVGTGTRLGTRLILTLAIDDHNNKV